MLPLDQLTYLGQVRRLRRLAENALACYGLDVLGGDARLTLLQHAENTTFRVDVTEGAGAAWRNPPGDDSTLYQPGSYLLRIHRDGYHDAVELRAELAWLAALRQEASLPVPEPVSTPLGETLISAAAPNSSETRYCTLLRWMRGRQVYRRPRPQHMASVGALMARLHQQVRIWQPPQGFTRGAWDWQGLFGARSGWIAAPEVVWGLLPEPIRTDCREVAERTRLAMAEMDAQPDSMALLHADLHLGNVLIGRSAQGQLQARALDFDDSGYAHWIYDLATALAYNVDNPRYPALRAALLKGYAQVAPLPESQLPYLNLFIAARYVSVLLWATDMAQVKPNIAYALQGWMPGMHAEAKAYLEGVGWAAS